MLHVFQSVIRSVNIHSSRRYANWGLLASPTIGQEHAVKSLAEFPFAFQLKLWASRRSEQLFFVLKYACPTDVQLILIPRVFSWLVFWTSVERQKKEEVIILKICPFKSAKLYGMIESLFSLFQILVDCYSLLGFRRGIACEILYYMIKKESFINLPF